MRFREHWPAPRRTARVSTTAWRDIDLIGVCIEDSTAKLCGGGRRHAAVRQPRHLGRTYQAGRRAFQAGDTDRTIYGLIST